MPQARPQVLAVVDLTEDVLAATPPRLEDALPAAQRAWFDALCRTVDKADFLAARELARLLLRHFIRSEGGQSESADLAGLSFVQECVRCHGPHGRPRVRGRPDLHVSWAHSRSCRLRPPTPGHSRPIGRERSQRRGAIARDFDLCQSTVSEHLAVLSRVGLVAYEERAGRRIYSLAADPTRSSTGRCDWRHYHEPPGST